MMRPAFADHDIDAAMIGHAKSRPILHLGSDGAHFTRPVHMRLLGTPAEPAK